MSARKPLVKFENQGQAKVVTGSMPARKKSSRQAKKTRSSGSSKPRVIKGRVNLRVAGYSGVQKVAPSKLIPFLSAAKVRQAAKRALLASSSTPRVKRRRSKKRSSKKRN